MSLRGNLNIEATIKKMPFFLKFWEKHEFVITLNHSCNRLLHFKYDYLKFKIILKLILKLWFY